MFKLEKQIREQSELREKIDLIETELEALKTNRSGISKHLDFMELPDTFKFEKLKSSSRLLLNAIKMIDYRAETSMSLTLKEFLDRNQDVRPILRELFKTEADIAPDPKSKTLNVHIHRMTTLRNDKAVKGLLNKLNETETSFPGTDMKLKYFLVE